MSVTVEPITEEQFEDSYGEIKSRLVLTELRITTPRGTRTIPPHGERRVLRHSDGTILDVDAAYYFNEPEIVVETNTDDIGQGEYRHWEFTSIAEFERWVGSNAELL